MECEPAVPSAISSELPPRSPPTEEESTGAGAEAKQSIVEIMDGEQLHGVPFQPGPQYKRGRGRSFFREAPRRGVVCQGEPGLASARSGCHRSRPSSPPALPCAVPACERSLHKLRDYYKVRTASHARCCRARKFVAWFVMPVALTPAAVRSCSQRYKVGRRSRASRQSCPRQLPASTALPAGLAGLACHLAPPPPADLPLPPGAAVHGGGGPEHPVLPAVRPLPAA